MTTKKEKTDTELKTDVLAELKFEPSVKTSDLGVLVQDGTVTLNGFATTYGEKLNAVQATRRVAGVRAIADDIEIKFPESLGRTDGEIGTAAANNIKWLAWVTPGKEVRVTVREGLVTLEGEVEHWYQKEAAENVVCDLAGVKGVFNSIRIKPQAIEANVGATIGAAFERNALVDTGRVDVAVAGGAVTLTGEVRNYDEREEAERVAWAARGVNSVNNKLTVEWSRYGD